MEILLEQGVDLVFGYPGAAVLHIYDALYKYGGRIRHVMTAHEQGAAHAADGYARLTGKTGVVIASSGPGATNLVTGIAAAYMDSVPLVTITGNVCTDQIGRDSFQEVYIAGITLPITKHNFTLRRVEDLAPVLRAAFAIAREGRRGPVLVDIPKDVSAAVCEYCPPSGAPRPCGPPPPYEGGLHVVAQALNNARRPAIYFGGGVQSAGAGEELRALCGKGDIPAAHTLMAAGVLGCDEPLNLGLIGMHGNYTANRAVQASDALLIAGARMSDRVVTDPPRFAPGAVKIQIDVDAAEINKNLPVDFALAGDVKEILAQLLPLIGEKKRPEWRAQVEQWRARNYRPEDGDSALRPHQIMRAISDLAGEDAVYVTDVGQHQLWAAQYARHLKPRSFLTSGGLGAMGFGYGAAIGAALALPAESRRPVVHITGDGSFHMNMNEACTAVSYNAPVITVIFNNQVLGMVRQWQSAFHGGRYCATDPQRVTDYVKLAEGFGLPGFRCHDLRQFREAFAHALTLGGPCWIECLVDKDEKVLPMVAAGDIKDIYCLTT